MQQTWTEREDESGNATKLEELGKNAEISSEIKVKNKKNKKTKTLAMHTDSTNNEGWIEIYGRKSNIFKPGRMARIRKLQIAWGKKKKRIKQIRAWSSRKLWVNRTDEVSAEGSGLIPTARRDTARFRLAGNASINPTHSPECIINTSLVIWWSICDQQVQVIHGCIVAEERIKKQKLHFYKMHFYSPAVPAWTRLKLII